MDQEKLREGVLCQLNVGKWTANKRLPKNHIDESVQEVARAVYDLVDDRTLLKEIQSIQRAGKHFLRMHSLQVPIDNVFWIPRDKIVAVDEEFVRLHAESRKRAGKLRRKLKKLKRDFQKKFPKLYDESYYPSESVIEERFYFRWRFFDLVLPDKKNGLLSAKTYKREQEKFQGMVKEMENLSVNLIGNMLHKRIEKLAEQCDTGKINAGTVNSIENFVGKWDDLWDGHVDQKQMRKIMNTLRRQMKRSSADVLKDNEAIREKLGSRLNKMMSKIENIPDFKLKRKMDV